MLHNDSFKIKSLSENKCMCKRKRKRSWRESSMRLISDYNHKAAFLLLFQDNSIFTIFFVAETSACKDFRYENSGFSFLYSKCNSYPDLHLA